MCYFRLCKDSHGRGDLFSLPSLLTSQMDHSHQGRAGMLSAAHPPNAAWISLPLKPRQKNIPNTITSIELSRELVHHSTKPSRAVCQSANISEQRLIICAKLSCTPRTAPASQQISKCEDEWFGPFLLFIVPFYPRIPDYQFQRWCPEPIAVVLWQSDVAVSLRALPGKLLAEPWDPSQDCCCLHSRVVWDCELFHPVESLLPLFQANKTLDEELFSLCSGVIADCSVWGGSVAECAGWCATGLITETSGLWIAKIQGWGGAGGAWISGEPWKPPKFHARSGSSVFWGRSLGTKAG